MNVGKQKGQVNTGSSNKSAGWEGCVKTSKPVKATAWNNKPRRHVDQAEGHLKRVLSHSIKPRGKEKSAGREPKNGLHRTKAARKRKIRL